jgi:hypothetical protein
MCIVVEQHYDRKAFPYLVVSPTRLVHKVVLWLP